MRGKGRKGDNLREVKRGRERTIEEERRRDRMSQEG